MLRASPSHPLHPSSILHFFYTLYVPVFFETTMKNLFSQTTNKFRRNDERDGGDWISWSTSNNMRLMNDGIFFIKFFSKYFWRIDVDVHERYEFIHTFLIEDRGLLIPFIRNFSWNSKWIKKVTPNHGTKGFCFRHIFRGENKYREENRMRSPR